MSKEDRKLIEKTKRALGLGGSNDNQPASTNLSSQRDNNARDSGRDFRSLNRNEPVSVGGPDSSVNLKDTLLGTLQSISLSKSKKKWQDPHKMDSSNKHHQPAVNPNSLLSSSGAGTFKPLQMEMNVLGKQAAAQQVAPDDLEEPNSVHQTTKVGNLLAGGEKKDSDDENEKDETEVDFQLV